MPVPMRAPVRRPTAVTVLGWLFICLAALAFLRGVVMLMSCSAHPREALGPPMAGVMNVLLGAVVAVLAAYFLMLRAWARTALEVGTWLALVSAIGLFVLMLAPDRPGSGPEGSGFIFLYLAAFFRLVVLAVAAVFSVGCVLVLRVLRSPEVRRAVTDSNSRPSP